MSLVIQIRPWKPQDRRRVTLREFRAPTSREFLPQAAGVLANTVVFEEETIGQAWQGQCKAAAGAGFAAQVDIAALRLQDRLRDR